MTLIFCDGGCTSNGTADAKAYGSFLVEGERLPHRVDLDGKTNNEAEYQTLIATLRYVREHQYELVGATIRTDSRLIVEQVAGNWKVRKPELRPLCDEARALVHETGAVLEWTPRDEIVARLGH